MTPEFEELKDRKRRKDRNGYRERNAKAKLDPKLATAQDTRNKKWEANRKQSLQEDPAKADEREAQGKKGEANRKQSLQQDCAKADTRQAQGKKKEANRKQSLQQHRAKADAHQAQGKKWEKTRKAKLDTEALERRLEQLILADEKRQRLDKDPARMEKRREQKAQCKRYVHATFRKVATSEHFLLRSLHAQYMQWHGLRLAQNSSNSLTSVNVFR